VAVAQPQVPFLGVFGGMLSYVGQWVRRVMERYLCIRLFSYGRNNAVSGKLSAFLRQKLRKMAPRFEISVKNCP